MNILVTAGPTREAIDPVRFLSNRSSGRMGYAIAAAASVSPFTYFSVIFGALYGYLFWDEGLSLQFVIGALIIALAGMLALKVQGPGTSSLVSRTAES